jgi:hypothetical protein
MAGTGLKGKLSNTIKEVKDVTVTDNGTKTGIDVNIIGGSSGGGSGDASAANQTLQISEAQDTNTKLDSANANLIDLQEIPVHTHYRLTYVASGNGVGEIETIEYYMGTTASEVLVETRTFSYDTSNRVVLMEKS